MYVSVCLLCLSCSICVTYLHTLSPAAPMPSKRTISPQKKKAEKKDREESDVHAPFSYHPPTPPPSLTLITNRNAPPATHPSTARRTSSNPAAAGPPTSTPSPAPSPATPTPPSACPAPRSCAVSAGAIWATCSRGRGIRRRRMSGIALIVLV